MAYAILAILRAVPDDDTITADVHEVAMAKVKVFIAGSRAITRLTDAIRLRLDRIMAERHTVIVGDANGADKAVQRYLADHRYDNVVVYFTGLRFRNNVGSWPTQSVTPPAGVGAGFEFYAAKDRAMALDATHGLMLWDGTSRGTFANITTMVTAQKPVVVYLDDSQEFVNVRDQADVDTLLSKAKPAASA